MSSNVAAKEGVSGSRFGYGVELLSMMLGMHLDKGMLWLDSTAALKWLGYLELSNGEMLHGTADGVLSPSRGEVRQDTESIANSGGSWCIIRSPDILVLFLPGAMDLLREGEKLYSLSHGRTSGRPFARTVHLSASISFPV
ncbi:hypothetical protein BTVI_15530 [Pitangus sulphuratus]|nr:hypothetical protein BTVI_15530 [Pitangus sulphuratus]